MKKLRSITENEMIAVFLKAEIKSDRWANTILSFLHRDGKDMSILENPDTYNQEENIYRKQLLGEFRGYGKNNHLFQDFPTNVRWERVLLTKNEPEKILYTDWDYWVNVTNGTRSPKYLADKINNGRLVEDEEVKRFKSVAKLLKSGAKFPEMILVAKDENSRLVVLEGHLRLTTYFLVQELIPEELEVIIGFSEDITSWGLY